MRISRIKIFKYLLFAVIYGILAYLFYLGWQNGQIKEFVKAAGFLAPLIFIMIAAFKAVFPVIPGEVVAVLGVLLFGPVFGFIYTLIGITIGSTIAFLLARRYGQPFVEFVAGKERFKRVHDLTGDKTLFTFFLIYLVPGTPDDIVTYIGGLTSLNIVTFITIAFFGRLPAYLLYILAGTSLHNLNYKLLLVSWALLFILVGILYFSKKHYLDRSKKK
jgi:uncharacterized membrane protein YdjX (TVP38/TMEM64 family)